MRVAKSAVELGVNSAIIPRGSADDFGGYNNFNGLDAVKSATLLLLPRTRPPIWQEGSNAIPSDLLVMEHALGGLNRVFLGRQRV